MTRTWIRRVVMLLVTLVLLALTVRLVGLPALLAGGGALTPATIAAALAFGFLATGAQAVRFSLLLGWSGTRVTRRRALADCYSAGLLNMVLPGGLGGDLARVAAYRNAGAQRWLSGLTVVGAERLSATTLLFATAALTLVPAAPGFAVISAVVAVVAGVLSFLGMRQVPAASTALVWLTAAISIASFLGLYLTAMLALGGPIVPALAVVGLAAMSIPLGVGGWGVREVSVSVLAGGLGSSADWAVTSSTGYGLLAVVSTLPGAVTVVLRLWGRRRRADDPVQTRSQPDR